jgi:REP element-mobilizing transposase RayT
VSIRGHNRERIFVERRDYRHFLELLEKMREWYGVRVYAYCLMPNHYHLLIGTPAGNLSQAMRWLNGSYGVWFNRRHEREGHVFGERFRAVLVENRAWGLEASVYIHMNPVVTQRLGLGKKRKQAEGRGFMRPPTREERERRLRALREYKWSSYQAYAGYSGSPAWLDREALLARAGKEGEKSYRSLVEERIRQGEGEELGAKVRWGLVLGAERFAKKVRGRIHVNREHAGQGELRRLRTFDELVKMVERIKEEPWEAFRDRYGDWGRDLVLWSGRRYGGMTLAELGERAGRMDYSAVAMAVRRMEGQRRQDRGLRAAIKRVAKQCAM